MHVGQSTVATLAPSLCRQTTAAPATSHANVSSTNEANGPQRGNTDFKLIFTFSFWTAATMFLLEAVAGAAVGRPNTRVGARSGGEHPRRWHRTCTLSNRHRNTIATTPQRGEIPTEVRENSARTCNVRCQRRHAIYASVANGGDRSTLAVPHHTGDRTTRCKLACCQLWRVKTRELSYRRITRYVEARCQPWREK
jgi:hypothetical protein